MHAGHCHRSPHHLSLHCWCSSNLFCSSNCFSNLEHIEGCSPCSLHSGLCQRCSCQLSHKADTRGTYLLCTRHELPLPSSTFHSTFTHFLTLVPPPSTFFYLPQPSSTLFYLLPYQNHSKAFKDIQTHPTSMKNMQTCWEVVKLNKNIYKYLNVELSLTCSNFL